LALSFSAVSRLATSPPCFDSLYPVFPRPDTYPALCGGTATLRKKHLRSRKRRFERAVDPPSSCSPFSARPSFSMVEVSRQFVDASLIASRFFRLVYSPCGNNHSPLHRGNVGGLEHLPEPCASEKSHSPFAGSSSSRGRAFDSSSLRRSLTLRLSIWETNCFLVVVGSRGTTLKIGVKLVRRRRGPRPGVRQPRACVTPTWVLYYLWANHGPGRRNSCPPRLAICTVVSFSRLCLRKPLRKGPSCLRPPIPHDHEWVFWPRCWFPTWVHGGVLPLVRAVQCGRGLVGGRNRPPGGVWLLEPTRQVNRTPDAFRTPVLSQQVSAFQRSAGPRASILRRRATWLSTILLSSRSPSLGNLPKEIPCND